MVFLAVDFRLRLGLEGAIRGDPYSVEVVPEPLVRVLSAEESMSLTKMGSTLDDWTSLKVLCDARWKDFLVGWTEGLVEDFFGLRGRRF